MGSIRALTSKVQGVDLHALVELSIEATKDEIVILNRSDLVQGLRADGAKIGDTDPYRFQLYAEEKYGQNPIPGLGNPDLKLTGAFYQGIYVTINHGQNSFTLDSLDQKSPMLQKKYGKLIFGLTKGSKSLYALYTLKPVLFEKINEALR